MNQVKKNWKRLSDNKSKMGMSKLAVKLTLTQHDPYAIVIYINDIEAKMKALQ